MAMPVSVHRFTVDEVDAIPEDGNRHELLDGLLLVTPAPGQPHQAVATRLTVMLGGCLAAEPEARIWAPGVLVLRPFVKLEPDILIGRRPTGGTRWENVTEHWLAVEVSGTGSRIYDRDYQRDGYLGLGVHEVWLVDLDAMRVFVSRRGETKNVPHDRTLAWRSPGGRSLEVDVVALFSGIGRDD